MMSLLSTTAEVGKTQLEAQSATSASSAIAEIALHFNFYFETLRKLLLRAKVFKICCALIALRFQFFFFRLIAQFYALNLILFHFNRNIDKCWPCLANYLLFFCLKSQKMRCLHCVVKF